MCLCLLHLKRVRDASELVAETVSFFRKQPGQRHNLARSLMQQSVAATLDGHFREAEAQLREAIDLFEEDGAVQLASMARLRRAELYFADGPLEASAQEAQHVADLLAERLEHVGIVRQDRPASIERLQNLLPGLIPSWGIAAGRHVIVTGADQRILARVPIETAPGETNRILQILSAAQPMTMRGAPPAGVTDIVLPNGGGALATQRIVRSLPGQVIVIQEKTDSLWRSDTALSITLSGR